MVLCDVCERLVGSVHCRGSALARRYIRYCKKCDGIKRLDDYFD